MPYPHHDPIKPAPLKTLYLSLDDKEELQATLERVKKERDAWKDKAQVLELENEELQRQLKEQSGEDRAGKRPRVQEDLFSSGTTDYSQIPQSSGAWKGLVDSLVKEKAFMQKAYEERIERLERQLLLVYARPDDTCCLSWSSLLTVASRQQIHFKLTHNYNTRANYKRRMEITDNENRELKAQVAEAQDAQIQAQAQAAEMRNQMLTARLQAEEAQARAQVHNSGQTSAQNQPQIQNQTTAAPVTTVIASEINAVPVTSVTITASRPWEIPMDLNQDRYQQEFVPPNAPVFTNVPPVVHYTPHLGEPVYHGPTPSEDPGLNDRMDEFQDQFAELQKEIKALRGKDRMATGVVMKNWTAVDIPHCVHISK
ncbi:hypothetical protein KIW84_034665 [Lathyrus oleraceus]|uniref:Uncharacterized protein n=1 Tax=Pisum sativum TaxID=3888 RepID=A0A9D4Y000_PEA|nr:hypothetical protein KIW84_034665 [Pisum sativum]